MLGRDKKATAISAWQETDVGDWFEIQPMKRNPQMGTVGQSMLN